MKKKPSPKKRKASRAGRRVALPQPVVGASIAPPEPSRRRHLWMGLALGLSFALGFLTATRQGYVEVRRGGNGSTPEARRKIMRLEDGREVSHGPYESYYTNFKVKEAGEYFRGRKHGPWKEYHENGALKRAGSYVDGEPQNDWKEWDEKGNELKK